LRELADEGLVTLVPNVGARVALFDLGELIEVYRGRECLEPMIIAESIPHLSEEQIHHVEALVVETEACAARDDRLAYVEADRPLHFATFSGAGMPRLLGVVRSFWDTTSRYRRLYGLMPTSVETSIIEHRLLLEYIQKRNAEDAARTLTSHIRRTRLSLAEYVEQIESGWSARADDDLIPLRPAALS
jgi:DNA-binding GntR family transcriptional regulator